MLTYHGEKRARKRLRMNYEAAERKFEQARANGKTKADFEPRSKEYDYLLSKEHAGDTTAYAYGGVCFIADGSTCITLFNLPDWFEKKKSYNGKTEVRNMKTYIKHYDVNIEYTGMESA